MDIAGEYRLNVPRERVWEALNDASFLQRALPGCKSIEKTSVTEFSAKVHSKIGTVRAAFDSRITLTDLNQPESYKLVGEGNGGTFGFAKGHAHVHLADEGGFTVLRYEGEMQVGGKLARIGNRLLSGVARKTADQFFASFAEIVSNSDPVDKMPSVTQPQLPLDSLGKRRPGASFRQVPSLGSVLWIGILVLIVVLLWVAF